MDFSLCLVSSYPLCVSVSKFSFSHKDSSHIGLRHILKTLSWWDLQRISFQIMSHSQGPGVRTLTYILEYVKFISTIQSIAPSISAAHLKAFSMLVKGWSYGTDSAARTTAGGPCPGSPSQLVIPTTLIQDPGQGRVRERESLYWGEKEKTLIHSAVFLGVSNPAQSITHSLRSGAPQALWIPVVPIH